MNNDNIITVNGTVESSRVISVGTKKEAHLYIKNGDSHHNIVARENENIDKRVFTIGNGLNITVTGKRRFLQYRNGLGQLRKYLQIEASEIKVIKKK